MPVMATMAQVHGSGRTAQCDQHSRTVLLYRLLLGMIPGKGRSMSQDADIIPAMTVGTIHSECITAGVSMFSVEQHRGESLLV
jgi:hypothetical protein